MTFVLTGCSLLVDFPTPHSRGSEGDDSDAGAGRDGAARNDAGSQTDARATGSCDPRTHEGCADDQLCCAYGATGEFAAAVCIDRAGSECTACGVSCSDPRAPNCGTRSCECAAGSGEACPADERCVGAGASARCVQCTTDADCAANTELKQCVANQCVQCDRAALVDEASDDEGCNEPAAPICNASNRCVACTQMPDSCPGDQVCNGSAGCLGCNPSAAPGANGCGGTKPICKQTATDFSCQPCAATGDCSGSTPYCASEGERAGHCVACRSNSDCASNAGTPVCDTSQGLCRARSANDCSGSTPVLADGQCVECDASQGCATDRVCNLQTYRCVQCLGNAQCTNSAAPVCDLASGLCSGCTSSDDCAGRAGTPACNTATHHCVACAADTDCDATPATPLCSSSTNTCVACNSAAIGGTEAADSRCAALGNQPATPFCVQSGAQTGRCGTCDPGQFGPLTGQRGCTGQVCNESTASCQVCDPVTHQGCLMGTCRAQGSGYVCLSGGGPAPGGPPPF